MDRFLVAIIGIPLSFVIVYYRMQIKHFIGDVGFAEKIFGGGGTYTLILIIALLTFFGSLMYALGTLQTLLSKFLGPFFGV
jgi:hypothetical protein